MSTRLRPVRLPSLRAKRSNPASFAAETRLDCFRLRSPSFGGLQPGVACAASVDGSSLRSSQWRRRQTPSPRPAVAGVLHEIAVGGLFADVVLFVVAMALGGVEGNVGLAAGALVAL